jgi:hypothetical protein
MLIKLARVISWNLWQMDGLKYVAPFSCEPTMVESSMFGDIELAPCPGCKYGDNTMHTGAYCKIYDWRKDNSLEYRTMVKGGRL